ncbi:hypothetical protein C2S52_019554 [Perilla frutescens var. hirtella]|nr:hypothetical protein C2S52_019554 [Perilla frutescens var. hirtella]
MEAETSRKNKYSFFTVVGDASFKERMVMIKCRKTDECFFTEGWRTFRDKTRVASGFHMLVEQKRGSTYRVRMYDWNSCEQELVGQNWAVTDGSIKVASFFRFLRVNWSQTLRIPPTFADAYSFLLKGKTIKLATESGDRHWEVRLSKRAGKVWLEDGWPEFAQENHLRKGDFITFTFEAKNGIWKICAYDEKGLRKRGGAVSGEASGGLTQVRHRAADTYPLKLQFVREMKEYSLLSQLELPIAFARALPVSHGGIVTLQNEDGRTWEVQFQERANNTDVRFYIRQDGWAQFTSDNGCRSGDVLLFTDISSPFPSIGVMVLDSDSGKKYLQQTQRGGLL